jgi:hypothetical protein
MTEWTMQNTERDPRTLLGTFLRTRSQSAKELARRIGCDPRSAEGYRAGRYWPQARHWLGIVSAFGRDVTEAVFHPEAAAERLTQEVRALEDQLAQRRADLAATSSATPRLARIHGTPQDRAAGLKRSHDGRFDG